MPGLEIEYYRLFGGFSTWAEKQEETTREKTLLARGMKEKSVGIFAK